MWLGRRVLCKIIQGGERKIIPEMGESARRDFDNAVTHVSTINVCSGRPYNSVAKRFRSVSPKVKEEITYLFTLARKETKGTLHLSLFVEPGEAH